MGMKDGVGVVQTFRYRHSARALTDMVVLQYLVEVAAVLRMVLNPGWVDDRRRAAGNSLGILRTHLLRIFRDELFPEVRSVAAIAQLA